MGRLGRVYRPAVSNVSVAELSARARGIDPVLARPWVHVYDNTTDSAPWLNEDNVVMGWEEVTRMWYEMYF